jgi:hypothetical protein
MYYMSIFHYLTTGPKIMKNYFHSRRWLGLWKVHCVKENCQKALINSLNLSSKKNFIKIFLLSIFWTRQIYSTIRKYFFQIKLNWLFLSSYSVFFGKYLNWNTFKNFLYQCHLFDIKLSFFLDDFFFSIEAFKVGGKFIWNFIGCSWFYFINCYKI